MGAKDGKSDVEDFCRRAMTLCPDTIYSKDDRWARYSKIRVGSYRVDFGYGKSKYPEDWKVVKTAALAKLDTLSYIEMNRG